MVRTMLQLRNNWYTYSVYAVIMTLLALATFGSLSTHPLDTDDHGFLELASAAHDPVYLKHQLPESPSAKSLE